MCDIKVGDKYIDQKNRIYTITRVYPISGECTITYEDGFSVTATKDYVKGDKSVPVKKHYIKDTLKYLYSKYNKLKNVVKEFLEEYIYPILPIIIVLIAMVGILSYFHNLMEKRDMVIRKNDAYKVYCIENKEFIKKYDGLSINLDFDGKPIRCGENN